MKRRRPSLPAASLVALALIGGGSPAAPSPPFAFAAADPVDDDHGHDASTSCDAEGDVEGARREPHRPTHPPRPPDDPPAPTAKSSDLCPPPPSDGRPPSADGGGRSVGGSYRRGLSAQAYKPGAPVKSTVCDDVRHPHRVARAPFWRARHEEAVPLVVRGRIYGCGPPSSSDGGATGEGGAAVEAWQPRPDGTYSSLRPGAEEGDCRARVPIVTTTEGEHSNFLGKFQFETLAPGSPGILGGLVPGASRDYPPYGPGAIGLYVDLEGHAPLLTELRTSDLARAYGGGRFRPGGWDPRPHASAVAVAGDDDDDRAGGMEVRAAKGTDATLEVEVDVFLVPEGDPGGGVVGGGGGDDASDVFCSVSGLGRALSFFKEPIAVCFPSLLDFFAL